MKNNVVKTMIRNILIMGVLIFITFKYLLDGFSKKEIIHAVSNANKFYLFFAIVFSICYILFEAMNTKNLLQSYGYKTNILKCASYSFTGYFFSGLTPSATGGQPMQVLAMKTDSIKISHSSIILLIELCAFQFVTIIMAVIGFYNNYNYIFSNKGVDVWIIYVGIFTNILIFLFTFFIIFSKRFLNFVKYISFFFVNRIPFIKEKEKYKQMVIDGLEDYRKASIFIKSNKFLVIKVVIIETFQISSLYGISYLVYKSLGFNEHSFFKILFLQALVYVSVSTIPIPGAIGVSEKLFEFLFLIIYPKKLITESMLLTRGINFYLLFCMSAIIFMIFYGKHFIKKNKTSLNSSS